VSVVVEDYPRTLSEFETRFSSEEACRDYLFKLRWGDAWLCPRCKQGRAWPSGRGLWMCGGCGYQASVLAGTVLQDTKLPLTTWFRAMWFMTSQKTGISALGLQRLLGLGSYRTAWLVLHKLRRAMVRPGRERLAGLVEVDETYLGGLEEGRHGRRTFKKALIIVAAQADGAGIGRVRLRRLGDLTKASVHSFIHEAVEPGGLVRTDGLASYAGMEALGYRHDPQPLRGQKKLAGQLLPRVHRVVSLLKRWLMGTHQGAISHEHLDDYLDEFTFRFNRRHSRSRGKLFYRLAQQAVQVQPCPYQRIVKGLKGTTHKP
jgi:transposase-like protein/ribosomal protein L37AE/L43A